MSGNLCIFLASYTCNFSSRTIIQTIYATLATNSSGRINFLTTNHPLFKNQAVLPLEGLAPIMAIDFDNCIRSRCCSSEFIRCRLADTCSSLGDPKVVVGFKIIRLTGKQSISRAVIPPITGISIGDNHAISAIAIVIIQYPSDPSGKPNIILSILKLSVIFSSNIDSRTYIHICAINTIAPDLPQIRHLLHN